jgi:hypothetical protein
LKRLRQASTTRNYSLEEKAIERKLCELFEREKKMIRQHSRVDWLQVGDHNTAFFQARVTARRRTIRYNIY